MCSCFSFRLTETTFTSDSPMLLGRWGDLVASILERGIDDGAFRKDLDVQATADVVCQLQSDYSGRAYRNDARFPDDPRIINAVVDLIRAAVGTIRR